MNHTNLDNHITNQIYAIGYHKLVRYGLLKDQSTNKNANITAENTIIENNHDHLASFIVVLKFFNVIFSCFSAFHLAGNRDIATNNHTISITNAILNGNNKLIVVKNGSAMIKNMLKKETRPLIDEDIFLNLSSFFNSVSVS
ncbi:MAG: hypothetical protein WCG25_08985 [bacterium]